MKFFSLIKNESLHPTLEKKVIPASEFSKLVEADEVLKQATEEAIAYRLDIARDCEVLKEQAEEAGFEAGLQKWNEQLRFLENEITKVRREMEKSVISLALAAVKKIIGKELETRPQTIVDIISTSLKGVTQHRRITLYVNKLELEYVEAERTQIKNLFEHLDSLSIEAAEDVEPGGCRIVTEVGIINAKLENQLKALEEVFKTFYQNNSGGE